jgi:hypothetical protein
MRPAIVRRVLSWRCRWVLQSGHVAISPKPELIFEAAAQLRMGQARRFTLLFRERFWEHLSPQPALHELSFLFAFSEMPPVWWTPHPEASHSITGWVGGPHSAAFAGMDAEELGRKACTTLAKIFGVEENRILELLCDCYTHDWQADRFSFGAYSYVATGGLSASRQMTVPVAETLFFAGEHTDVTGNWGTVHAAMRSGLRADPEAAVAELSDEFVMGKHSYFEAERSPTNCIGCPQTASRMHFFVCILSIQIGCNVGSSTWPVPTPAGCLCIGQNYGHHKITAEHSRRFHSEHTTDD